MSHLPANPVCNLTWDKLSPGRLRYTLGPIELLSSGVIYHGSMKTHIPQGQGLTITRNLMLYFPGFVTFEILNDRLWSEAQPPAYARQCISVVICKLSRRLPKVGLRIIPKHKVGYRLEFIPDWEEL